MTACGSSWYAGVRGFPHGRVGFTWPACVPGDPVVSPWCPRYAPGPRVYRVVTLCYPWCFPWDYRVNAVSHSCPSLLSLVPSVVFCVSGGLPGIPRVPHIGPPGVPPLFHGGPPVAPMGAPWCSPVFLGSQRFPCDPVCPGYRGVLSGRLWSLLFPCAVYSLVPWVPVCAVCSRVTSCAPCVPRVCAVCALGGQSRVLCPLVFPVVEHFPKVGKIVSQKGVTLYFLTVER